MTRQPEAKFSLPRIADACLRGSTETLLWATAAFGDLVPLRAPPASYTAHGPAHLLPHVIAGQHVQDGVHGAVDGGQAQADAVGGVQAPVEGALVLHGVEADGAAEEDGVVRREAHQEHGHHAQSQPTHLERK